MSLKQAIETVAGMTANMTRGVMHSMYPNDFEYYMMSFELINSKGVRENMLVFPVLPEEITQSVNTLSSVKKTSSAVVAMFNPTFVPYQISISGTFGKRLRILLGEKEILGIGFNIRSKVGKQSGSKPTSTWNTSIKTGYGVTKVLEGILEKSQSLDIDGKPYRLVFNNASFNNDTVVEINNYRFSQSARSNNGYWDYAIQMTAIAPAVAVRTTSPTSLQKLIAIDQLNKFAQGFIDNNKANFFKRLKL